MPIEMSTTHILLRLPTQMQMPARLPIQMATLCAFLYYRLPLLMHLHMHTHTAIGAALPYQLKAHLLLGLRQFKEKHTTSGSAFAHPLLFYLSQCCSTVHKRKYATQTVPRLLCTWLIVLSLLWKCAK